MGVELKNNVKRAWWRANVYERDDMEGLDAAILMNKARPAILRPRSNVLRSAGRLPQVQEALSRRSRRSDGKVPGRRLAQLHRAAAVQPDVQDDGRPGRRRRQHRLSAAGDGAGHLRQLQERPRFDEPQAAVRHCPDRQGVPQRDHAEELHLPRPRVRADGDRVLRHARARTKSGTSAGSRIASPGITSTASGRRICRQYVQKPEELAHYAKATTDLLYRFFPGARRRGQAVRRSRRHRQPHGLRSDLPHQRRQDRFQGWLVDSQRARRPEADLLRCSRRTSI